jgi:LysR family glycine cleavage system transcriptional activator
VRSPSLNALRAFEAAGRHGSFAKAAEEMHLTAGAISRQVKILEEHLELTLFDRRAQGLRLTEVGKNLLPAISDAFEQIARATANAKEASNEVRMLVAPTFAVRWLIPRLSHFRELHPEIRVTVSLYLLEARFSPDEYDLEICQDWWLNPDEISEDTEKRILRYERLAPVCTPSLGKRTPRLRKPSDLEHRTLLHALDSKDWVAWLRAAGDTKLHVQTTAATTYPTADAAAHAAMAGKGVAIVDLDLYKYEIDSGQLVAPFDFVLDHASPIVFTCSAGRIEEAPVSLIFDWLAGSMRSDR